MHGLKTTALAAAILACLFATPLRAAAPEPVFDTPAAAPPTKPVAVYELDTEMVVKNWVLCMSAAVAEQLVRARAESVERALAAYADLQKGKLCGRVPQMLVILKERLDIAGAGTDARAYGGLINLSETWASAYLVAGGLPEPQ